MPLRRVNMQMPLPIIVATVAVALVLGLNVISLLSSANLQSALGIILAALLLIGLVRAHRLAWQWGRYLAPFSGLVFIVGALANFAHGNFVNMLVGTLDLIIALGMLVFPILLSRDSAVRYFRLICPACATRTKKAADFFFNRAKCQKCQRTW